MKPAAAATVFGCASVLLSYPDDRYADDLAAVAQAARGLPRGSARAQLEDVTAWLAGLSPIDAAATYVDTFDLRRGVSLYLTYYRHGDTRERGMALAALVDAFRAAGFRTVPGELPDYLPALLELAAVRPAGASVLGEHRMALDALRLALVKADNRYAGVVTAVCGVLPGPTREDRDALRRYRSQGPPSEQVGLEPFIPPDVLNHGVTNG